MIDITRFFQIQGMSPEPHHFLDTDILIGWKICTPDLDMVYRQEKERLIICDFHSTDNNGKSVMSLLSLLRKAVNSVSVLRYVDAMIIPAYNNDKLNAKRNRLIQLMVGEGATVINLEGDLWLRIHY